MLGIIGTGVIEIIILLMVLKSGWMLDMLQNVPFMDLVVNIVSRYWGTLHQTLPSSGKFFLSELLQALIYIIIFKIISELCHQLFHIGKHARVSAFEIMFSPVMEFITKYFVFAVITAYLLQLFQTYVLNTFKNNILAGSLSAIIVTAFCVITFFLFKLSLSGFFMCILGYVIFPSVVQLISIEFIVTFCYYMLNTPGIFEQAGTLVIIIFGISCCIGAVIGCERVKDIVADFFGIL